MPYINQKDRAKYDGVIQSLTTLIGCNHENNRIGHLNYIITKLLLGTRPRYYREYNALIGVLECAKLELYRRQIAVYEEEKMVENGDVY